MQQRLAAAEVVAQRDDLPAPALTPARLVALKDARVREAEAVDALLHVADEEAVSGMRNAFRALPIATDRADDRILHRVDVLALVHEDMLEALAIFAA